MNPIIKPMSTDEEMRRLTEELLGDAPDEKIRTFIQILETVKNADCEQTYHLAATAQRYAFSKTMEFENAFRAFAGQPQQSNETEKIPCVFPETKAVN